MPATILRPHFLTLKNRLFPKAGGTQHLKRDILLVFVASLVMLCIFTALTLIFSSLKHDPLFRALIPGKIVELLSYAFFFLLVISNTIATIGSIYTADSMNLLLSTPVTRPRLYFAKVLEILLETNFMLFIFVIPTALAYRFSLHVSREFFVLGALLLVPYMLIPVGLGITIGTLFVNVLSHIWKRGAFFLLCLFIVSVWAISRFFYLLGEIRIQKGGVNAIVQFIGLFDNPNPYWLPSAWIANTLNSRLVSGGGDYRTEAVLLIISAIGSLALGYIVFDLLLLRARNSVGSHGQIGGKNAASPLRDIFRTLLEKIYFSLPLKQPTRAMILKDLSSLVRDHAQSLQLLLYLGIASIYVLLLRFLGDALNMSPLILKLWVAFLGGMNVLFAGFVMTAMMTRLVYPSVSLEGRAFWLLQITPIRIEDVIRAKFWCWFPITTFIAVSLLLCGGLAIDLPLPGLLYTALIGLTFSFGTTGLAVGIGALFASFDWESPSQISAGLGTLMLLLLGAALSLILTLPASVLIFLSSVPELAARVGPVFSITAQVACVFVLVFTNLTAARYSWQQGAKSLLAKKVS